MHFQLNTPLGRIVVSSDTILPHPGVGQLFISCAGCDELKSVSSFGFRQLSDGTVTNERYCRQCRHAAGAART